MQRSVAEPKSFKPEGPNAYNLKIWLWPSGNHERDIGKVVFVGAVIANERWRRAKTNIK